MSERWEEYFNNKMLGTSPLKYAFEHWNFLLPAFQYLFQFVPAPAKILDVGCGLGFTGIFLEAHGYTVTGIDYNDAVIAKAKEHAEFFHSKCCFEVGDATNLKKYHNSFDATISFGVIEHFDRHVTIELLRDQAACSPVVLATIPTRYSGDPITDERLYSLKQFAELFKEANMQPLKKFTLGETGSSPLLQEILPSSAYRIMKRIFSYAPGIGVLAKRES